MRRLFLLAVLAALTSACPQSLTPDKSGTGGTGTGSGGTGGTVVGSGGTGASYTSPCNTLAAEYQSALAAAETCQVGASGQCQQMAAENISGCSCPTYVTDSSALSTIAQAWQAAGCAPPTAKPPCELNCPLLSPATSCVSADGGTIGFCSYVPPGTGGSSGAGGETGTGGISGAGGSWVDGGGPSPCSALASQYAAVLNGAKSCTPGAAGQCSQLVPTSLSDCGSECTEPVTDRSILDNIKAKWDASNCANTIVCTALIACPSPTTVTCAPTDAGGSICVGGFQTFASP